MSQDGDGLQADALDRPGPPPELREPPRRSRAIGAFLATFALAAFAGVVWYAYDRGLQAGSEATAPLIQADPSPVKVRPEQPGGLDVPNQDKLVYGALRPGQDDGSTVERLLPAPEKPVEPPRPVPAPEPVPQETEDRGGPQPLASAESAAEATAADNSATVPIPARTPRPVTTQAVPAPQESAPAPAAPVQSATAPTPIQAPQPAASDVPPASTQPTPVAPPPPPPPAPKPEPAAAPPTPAPEPPKQEAAAPPPQPAPQPASQPAGRYRVQLGAFRDEAAARREWDRLTKRYPDVLSNLTLRIQRVDLGAEKGVFHRIQGGMLTEDGAEGVCTALKARDQPCLLVRP